MQVFLFGNSKYNSRLSLGKQNHKTNQNDFLVLLTARNTIFLNFK